MANVLMGRFINLGTKIIRNNEFLKYSSCMNALVLRSNEYRKYTAYCHNLHQIQILDHKLINNRIIYEVRQYSSENNKPEEVKEEMKAKPSIFKRFKQMYKEYWYVLLPVHVVTSIAWFGGFYYLAKSGVDICAILQSLHVSEKIISPFKDSSMGYVAVAYALYKIATPARYTVTLGGTTISINYLKKWGYIKPAPSAERLKEMYLEKKDDFIDGLKVKSEQFKDTKENMIDDLDKGIKQIKEMGEKIKPGNIMEKVKDGMKK